MTITLINSFLSHHPYYSKLTSYQKLMVLNIALTKYYEWKGTEVVHSQMLDGHVGIDDTLIDNDVIVKVPQLMLDAKSLSKYSELNTNLSDSDFVKEFTEDERAVLYQIALSKVSRLIPEDYSVETMTGDITFSKYTNSLTIDLDYQLDALILKSVYAYKDVNSPSYDITGEIERFKAFMDLPVLSYTMPPIPSYTAFMDLPTLSYSDPGKVRYAYLNLSSYSYSIRSSIAEPHVESGRYSYMPTPSLTYSLEHI